MALAFGNATGNLFNRLGKLGLVIKQLGSYQSSQKTNLIDTANGIIAQLNAEPDIQAEVGDNYVGSLNSPGGVGSTMQTLASDIVNRMIFRDNPQPNQTLQSANLNASLVEIIRQMKVQGATVLAMTITTTPGTFTGTGNGIIIGSTVRPSDGKTEENSYAETLTATCVTDSYSGNATAGQEQFTVTGQGKSNSPFNFDWPLGSNCRFSLTAINGNANNTGGNLLNNSNYASWSTATPPAPNNYTIVAGGGNLAQETTLIYDGTSALKLTGDSASTKTEWKQQFNLAAGTAGKLTSQSQYGFNIFLRRDGVAAGAGILTISLVDANNNTILDANGVANSFTIDLTALSTNYANFTAVFRTPVILPASQFLRFQLTTALTNGRSVYIAKGSLGTMTQAYSCGPWYSLHAASVPFVQGDYAFIPVTNSRGASGTLNTFQTLWSRLFYPTVINNDLLLPSSATPTLSDGVLIA